MRFLADESCDFSAVRALRAAGFDVTAIAEMLPRTDDETVARLAAGERRVLITEDKDFGQLVFAKKQPSGGVILIRFPARSRQSLPRTIVELVRRMGEHLEGNFVVLQPGRTRTRRRI
jgi:predicted nuclease of predicted toxin-antitoxin system